jgi:hypothetical protein
MRLVPQCGEEFKATYGGGDFPWHHAASGARLRWIDRHLCCNFP